MKEKKKTAVSPPAHDNLAELEGLGAVSAKKLNAIGVHTFADLAQFGTANELHEALEQQDQAIHLSAIENTTGEKGSWIEQAQQRVEETAKTERNEWQEHAYFSLKFEHKTDKNGQQTWRTWIYREQNGGAKTTLPTTEATSWSQWILDHANLPVTETTAITREDEASSPSKPSDEIELLRGGHKLTFKKVGDTFAVRLQTGQAENEAMLESAVGVMPAQMRHVESHALERFDVFRLEDSMQVEDTIDDMRKASAADIVTHVYQVDDTPAASVIPTGTLTIQFKDGVSKNEKEAILIEFGLQVVEDIDYLTNGHTVGLTKSATKNPLKIAQELQARDIIETAEPDLTVPTVYEYAPQDNRYPDQWHLNNRGDGVGLKQGADVKAEAAWEITRGTRDITICVMDDGFDLAHPEFNAPGKIVAQQDFIEGDNDPNPGTSDNHGTACAGVALAEENGQGTVGLAPNCSFMPIRMGNLSDNAVAAYFQYAIDNGADVISCSWSARPWNFPLSAKMQGIIRKAATVGRNGKGCVILFAAGNQSRPLDGVKDGRLSHQGFALHPDVLAVAASSSLDTHANYSNTGNELAICAPSSADAGRSIVTTDRRGSRGYSFGNYTATFGGTSSATPLAAGLAALILSVNPDLTAVQVKEIMMQTADKIDPENGRYVDGHSPLYGHGRINAQKALAMATGTLPEPPDDIMVDTPLDVALTILELNCQIAASDEDQPTQHLHAVVQFELAGKDVDTLTTAQTAYQVELYTEKEGQGSQRVAVLETRLQPNRANYTNTVSFQNPQEQGTYHPCVRVALAGEKWTDCYKGTQRIVVR